MSELAELQSKQLWVCDTCGSGFAEYINGCPHCWDAGIRSSVCISQDRAVLAIEERIRDYPVDGVTEHGIFPTYGCVMESTARGRDGWKEWFKKNFRRESR